MKEEIKYYPLTQSQSMIFYQLKYCMRKEITNICTEVEFQAEENTNLLLQAIYLGILRAPACSVRVHQVEDDKSMKQYFSDAAPEKIEFLDLSSLTEEEYQEQLMKWNSTPFPNKLQDTQLYLLKLLKKPNGKLAVYGRFCHLIADAYSIMMTYKDILNLYIALRDQSPLPAPPPSPLPAYEADFNYVGSEREKADAKFFDEVIYATEPLFTTPEGKNDKHVIKGKRYGKYVYNPMMPGGALECDIPRELDQKIVEFSRQNKISPQVVYLLGIRTYLSHVCEADDVLLMSSVARRATLAQKRAGGTMINSVPIRTIFKNDISFLEAVQNMYNVQCEVYRHANYDCGKGLAVARKKFGSKEGTTTYQNVGTSYQPYFALDGKIPVKFRYMANGRESQALYLTIMPTDSEGHLITHYSYQKSVIRPETLKKMHQFMLDFLEKGTEDPSASLQSLIDSIL